MVSPELAPGEEAEGVAVISGPRVGVGQGVGEEGEEPLGGLVGNGGGQKEAATAGGEGTGGGDDGQIVGYGAAPSSCVSVSMSGA